MQISRVLQNVNNNLDENIDNAVSLLLSCDAWRRNVNGNYRPISVKHKADIIAISFFKMFLSWEEFLEESFLRLLVEAKSGTKGVRSLLDVKTKKEAFKIVKGDSKAYIDWADVKKVRARAVLFFKDGKPYEQYLAAGSLHLDRMRKIRNRIAHRSQRAEKEFKDLVRELFGAYHHETPGSLLFRVPPVHFGLPPGASSGSTIVQSYASILKVLASQIASCK